MTSTRSSARLLTACVTAVLVLSACGSDGESSIELTPAGDAGRALALEKGCAACHGPNGEGRVGPAFSGLFGSTVELEDGSTVVADEAYIVESIKEPNAKRVAGFNLPMPQTDLTDDEISSIITYIRELAAPSASGTTGP